MPDIYDIFAGMNTDSPEEVEDIRRFQRLFLDNEDGQYVLVKILEQCKFMEPCDNEREMALNNFAKMLMEIVFMDIPEKSANNHRILEFLKKKFKRSK